MRLHPDDPRLRRVAPGDFRCFEEAVIWQRMARESYVRAMLFPNAARQRQAAHLSHMARRALFTLINGARA